MPTARRTTAPFSISQSFSLSVVVVAAALAGAGAIGCSAAGDSSDDSLTNDLHGSRRGRNASTPAAPSSPSDAGATSPSPAPSAPSDAGASAPSAAACARAAISCAGNGTTDDTSCLQTLISNAATSGGSVILPGAKSFKVSRSLEVPAGVSLEGCGATITLGQPGVVLHVTGSNVAIADVHLVYTANVEMGGLVDLGPGVSNVSVTGSHLEGAKGVAGVQINNVDISNVTISGNEMNNLIFGVLFNTTNWPSSSLGTLSHHPHDVVIDNNDIHDVTGDAIEVNSAVYAFAPYNSGKPGVAAHDIRISNNRLQASLSTNSSGGFCVGIAGGFNIDVTGNTMTHCKWQGVHLEDTANNIAVIGNTIDTVVGPKPSDQSSWGADDSSGVILLNVSAIAVLDNVIKNVPGAGVELSWNGTEFDHDVTIAQNTVTSAHYGFLAGGEQGQNLSTVIGPASYRGVSYGGNTANACTTPVQVYGQGTTVTGNTNF